jgi:hypothetical protein
MVILVGNNRVVNVAGAVLLLLLFVLPTVFTYTTIPCTC